MKTIVYVTKHDTNWLKGLAYFVDEQQLDFLVVQYETVEALLALTDAEKKNVLAIVLDWELPQTGLHGQEAYDTLMVLFPFSVVLILSSNQTEYFSFKRENTPPNTLLDYLVSQRHFICPDWIDSSIDRIIYSVKTVDLSKKEQGKPFTEKVKEKTFNNPNPFVSRQDAINYAKKTAGVIVLHLYGCTKDKMSEELFIKGTLAIYSGIILLEREMLTHLYAEYWLYKLNGFSTVGYEQKVHLPGLLKPITLLKGIADEEGKIADF